MRIALLGASGQMGKWLVEYFAGQNHALTISDVRRENLKPISQAYSARIAKDDIDAVKDAELVLVSVPVERTARVISEVGPHCLPNSILVEISSVKSGIIETMKKISAHHVKPVSLHPLFGPGAKKKQKKIALVPVLNVAEEKKLAKMLFPEAKLVVVNAETHDRAMAVVLSLSYLMNMTLAHVLIGEDVKLLRELSGTTFELQLLVTESIMAQKPELHTSLQMANEYGPLYLQSFLDKMTKFKHLIETRKRKGFKAEYDRIQKALSGSLDLTGAYEEMYKVLQFLEKSKH